MGNKPWWEPQLAGDATHIKQLRDDYPEHADMDDEELLDYFEVGDQKYSTTWDHLGDAYAEYEQLADAYFKMKSTLEKSGRTEDDYWQGDEDGTE